MTRATRSGPWLPRLSKAAGPLYLAIADALDADIRAGRLAPGDPLPTQRDLARRLRVNFTTITRAYTEAQRRGLLTATVGRGTFVAHPTARLSDPGHAARDHDLSVNAPPVPSWMPGMFRSTLERVAADAAVAQRVLTYESRLGDAMTRDAGATWLRARGLEPDVHRVVVTSGAQHALGLLLSTLAGPGDCVLTEALAYPGLQTAAAAAHIKLAAVAMDDEGLLPDAFDAMCQRARPKALFCVPTLQNPTAAVMSPERQRDVIAVARRHDVRIVEDDICGPLHAGAAPLAASAPDIVIRIASLSKCVAPGLRTAFVLLPTVTEAERLARAVRTSVLK